MDDDAALVPGAHRSVRLLDAKESAFAGELVTDGEQLRVRVDAERVAEALWVFASAEHVAGVRDVVRRPDGQDVLLPWCADTIDLFLGRRASAQRPLSAGEIVTLTGSMLRGIVETARSARGTDDGLVRGSWWLADDGRPVFVPGEGTFCAAAAAEILTRVRDACTDRAVARTLGEIITGTADDRIVLREIDRWEQELTQLAAPRPLEREVFAPERVSAIPLHQALLPQEARRVTAQRSPVRTLRARGETVREALREWLARSLPVRTKASEDRRPGRSGQHGRRRMLLTGVAVAAVVLLGGLLWPTDSDDSAATAAAKRTSAAGAPAAAEPAPAASDEQAAESRPGSGDGAAGDGAAGDDGAMKADAAQPAEKSVPSLLTRIASCEAEADARCESAVVDSAGEAVLERLSGAGASREVTPVEDYGDIAVIRLGAAGDRGEQMLVLVRQKDGWLVRDVYDVADQPSDRG